MKCSYCGAPIGTHEADCPYCGCSNEFYKEPYILKLAMKAMGSIGAGMIAKSAMELISKGWAPRGTTIEKSSS
ncbi:unnamed protein product [marine sediment metagenome]|uniref:Zinc-ribbon domain-containing protein n=1 Tax=marine sediment metagenome TaxID=412755 RepID=X1UYE2_9ZZZZ